MNRLTIWNGQTEQAELIDWDTEEWKEFMGELDVPISMSLGEAVDKLAEYEDLEEQGLLVRLPIKVGDTLWTNHRMQGWYFRSKDASYRVQVVFIGLNDSKEMAGGLFNVCYDRGYMMQFNFSDIGKTVFLTKAEAEVALERMK